MTDKTELIETAEKIVEDLSQKNYAEVKRLLSEFNSVDLAEMLYEIPDDRLSIVFRLLPKELAADVFVDMDTEQQETLLSKFNDKEIKDVLNGLFVDDTVDIIEEMPAAIVKRILKQADKETRDSINAILSYPPDSAGSIMTTEYVSLKEEYLVKDAFEKIRRTGPDKETIYTCYVTDKSRRLVGIVSARTLLLSTPDDKIADIMETNVISVDTHADKEYVAREIQRYGFLSMPVVDKENRLVGIVTVDDAMDVLREENNEDFSKMSAVTPSDKPYLKTSVFKIFLNRLPWLLLLMVSATFTSLIISSYEDALLGISVTLFACVPMLMDTGGNAGSQASVTIIRGIALGETMPKDVLKVIWKELRVALMLGVVMSIVCFGKLMVIDSLYNPVTPMVALTVSLALFITIVLAKFIGSTLPLLAKVIRLDPAVVASPFITTFVDAISLIIYSNIALALLG
ncbi:MAG: magnesium transporter [Clostridiales bacterium]|nr:magnesium transporter [Clostridiales bacterium]